MQKYIIPTRFQFYYEDFDTIPKYYSHKIPIESILSGRSSGVERNLAKVEVEGSNPFARSSSIYINVQKSYTAH